MKPKDERGWEIISLVKQMQNLMGESDMLEAFKLCRAVDVFATSMKFKLIMGMLAGKQGWDDVDEWENGLEGTALDTIRTKLIKHVEKGDPSDVANFAMFWWNLLQRGYKS